MKQTKEELLLFLHIQKTAGSTLRTFIKNQYDEDEIWFGSSLDKLKEYDPNKLKCVGGHFPYGIHQNFNRPFSYFTMLRDPVDRVLSYYYFIKNRPNRGKHERTAGMDIKDFMKTLENQTVNFQTKRLSGGKPNLEKAKQHLSQDFSFVGLTERFEESLFLMKKEYNWQNPEYKNRNITKQRAAKSELPKDVISFIEERNDMDIEIYRFAIKLFEKKLKSLSKKDRKEMNEFLNRDKEL
jgi:hypothetical protein